MNRSTIIAATILVVIVAYFGLRSVMRGSISSHKEEPVAARTDDVPSAVIEALSAEPHMMHISSLLPLVTLAGNAGGDGGGGRYGGYCACA